MNKPMSKAEIRKLSRRKIAEFRAVGIEWVEVLGGKCEDGPESDCEACVSLRDVPIEIDSAPELPLPGCDRKHCKCILISSEGPSMPIDPNLEDLSESRPAGFDQAVAEPSRPGVRAMDLVHNRKRNVESRNVDPGWVKWLMLGLLVLVLVVNVIWWLGLTGIFMLIGLATVGLLVGIFVRLGRKG